MRLRFWKNANRIRASRLFQGTVPFLFKRVPKLANIRIALSRLGFRASGFKFGTKGAAAQVQMRWSVEGFSQRFTPPSIK